MERLLSREVLDQDDRTIITNFHQRNSKLFDVINQVVEATPHILSDIILKSVEDVVQSFKVNKMFIPFHHYTQQERNDIEMTKSAQDYAINVIEKKEFRTCNTTDDPLADYPYKPSVNDSTPELSSFVSRLAESYEMQTLEQSIPYSDSVFSITTFVSGCAEIADRVAQVTKLVLGAAGAASVFAYNLLGTTTLNLLQTTLMQKLTIISSIMAVMQIGCCSKMFSVIKTLLDTSFAKNFSSKTEFEQLFTVEGFTNLLKIVCTSEVTDLFLLFINTNEAHKESIDAFGVFINRVFTAPIKELIRTSAVFTLTIYGERGFDILSIAASGKQLNYEDNELLQNIFYAITDFLSQLTALSPDNSDITRHVKKLLQSMSTIENLREQYG
jgi:hypothetical protein